MAQTTADILKAARELEARGERVSVRSVRAALGGGDPGTIGRALKEHRENTAALKEAAAQQPALPDSVTRVLIDWAGNLVADQAATARAELKDTNDDNEDLLAQVEELKGQIATLEAALRTAQHERDTTAGMLTAVQQQVQEQASELAKERARAAELDQQVANQKAQILAADETRQEIVTLRGENQRLIERATTAETALKAAEARAEAAENRERQVEQRARDAENDAAQARIEAAEAKATAKADQQRAADAETRAQQAETRALDAQQQLTAVLTAQTAQQQTGKGKQKSEEPESLNLFTTSEPGTTEPEQKRRRKKS